MKSELKILIVRFSSIGDIVLSTPVVRCLKKQRPAVRIHYLVKKTFSDILRANPYIDKLIELEDELDSLLPQLRAESYDYVIDLHNNLRSTKLKYALAVPAYTVNKLNAGKWLLVNFKINLLPKKHVVDRYLETVAPLGIRNDHAGLDYFIPREDEISIDRLPLTHLHGYVAVAFGAAHETKRIPMEKLMELCESLTVPIILVGGKTEQHTGDLLMHAFPMKVYNACGELNINQSASIVRKAKAVITADTGLMHIAAAFGKPIVSVWGNTVPVFGMQPYLPNANKAAQMEVTIGCRPCSKIGFEKCPRGHFKCMLDHDMRRVPDLLKDIV